MPDSEPASPPPCVTSASTATLLASATALFEAAPDATIIIDAGGAIVLVNRQVELLFGYTRAELLGQPVERLMPDRFAATHRSHRADFCAQPHVRPMGGAQAELLGRRKDGQEFPVEINLSPLITADGQLVISTIRDISHRRRMEHELRERSQLLHSIAANVPHSYLAVINRDLVVEYASGQEMRLRGLDPTAFFGRTVAEIFSPFGEHAVATVLAAYTRAFAGDEQVFELEIAGEHQLYRTMPIVDPDGAIRRILTVTENVTAQRQAEIALRTSEEHLRDVFEGIGAFVGLLTPEGEIIEVNRLAVASTGQTREQMIGRSFFDQVWWSDSPEERELVRDVIRRVAAGETVRLDLPARLGDGRRVMTDSIFAPLRDASGQVVRIVGSGIDITGNREAVQRLQALTAWQRAMLEHAAYAIISATPDGTIQTFNSAAAHMLGYAPEEVIGRETITLWHEPAEVEERARRLSAELGEPVAPGFEVFAVCARRNLPNEYEWTFVARDGAQFPALLSVTALRDDRGAITGYLGIARDISKQRRLEAELRQVQKLEAVGQLSGGVAHDFNNILTVIQGHVSILELQEGLAADTRAALGEIREAAERAANLTRQLLTFSRRQAMRPQLLDVNVVVANLARMLQRILGEDIRMELHPSPHEAVVFADTSMLEQVLLNLAVNSRDAMPAGGRLIIETAVTEFDDTIAERIPAARAGVFVRLTVTDTGAGIPALVLPRIFEPFFTTKEQGKGTGLGLATVYGIVQQHEGWVTVESEVGRGTTFRIYLPRKPGLPHEMEAARRPELGPSGRETILLVEDEPSLRALMTNLLTGAGYRVLSASSGPQALALWRAAGPGVRLLVTDIVMPDGMSGFDLGAELAREQPHLPIIYTSGYSPELSGRRDELIAGVNFLAKPFSMDRLLRAIRNALDRPVPE